MGTDVSGRPPVSWEEKQGSQSLSEQYLKAAFLNNFQDKEL